MLRGDLFISLPQYHQAGIFDLSSVYSLEVEFSDDDYTVNLVGYRKDDYYKHKDNKFYIIQIDCEAFDDDKLFKLSQSIPKYKNKGESSSEVIMYMVYDVMCKLLEDIQSGQYDGGTLPVVNYNYFESTVNELRSIGW